MAPTERMKSLARLTSIAVSTHAILLVVYSYANQQIDLLFEMRMRIPYLLIFCLCPIIIIFILQSKYVRQGAVILLGILPAALINNIINRFTGVPPFVINEPPIIWKVVFEAAFGLVLISEVVGSWLTFKLLQEIHNQIDEKKEKLSVNIDEKETPKSKRPAKRIPRKKKS